ncbi:MULTISPECIES: hypothetical protein [unclassified Gordonia (in: high G+C Gram-positive bacteria)]|uniref:hypothetical protein n=1 Tax=unclassified Gordonia (in: high G+C Gram-positive bacteria) TaxID=2657482 RepID=UPI001FFFA264|nr:hypothetical protein [Gordonia sp. PP30]UQE75167.1 hypothetical protein MYK68_00525 [Gordonia sp. PP30]
MTSRTRLIGTVAGAAAAGAMLIAPAAAHADGTKDPRYSRPPTTSQPKKKQDPTYTAPVRPCGKVTVPNGGYDARPQNFPVNLGRSGPTAFDITYDMQDQPDKLDVIYQGRQIATTGWRGSESRNKFNHPLAGPGVGSLTVNVPPGASKEVTVRVTADQDGTAWSFTAHCPS